MILVKFQCLKIVSYNAYSLGASGCGHGWNVCDALHRNKEFGYAVLALRNGMIAEAGPMGRMLDGIYERVGSGDADSSVKFHL